MPKFLKIGYQKLHAFPNLWILCSPLVLLLTEITIQRGYPYSSPYFWLLVKMNPFQFPFCTIVACLRAYLGYLAGLLALVSVVHLFISNPRLAKWLCLSLYLVVYTYILSLTFETLPSSHAHFRIGTHWYLRATIVGCVGFLFLFLTELLKSSKNFKINPFPKASIFLALSLLALHFTKPTLELGSPKKGEAQLTSQKPSFVFLSFDAVPGAIFNEGDGKKAVMPKWQLTRGKALHFSNAYSVTNSTFTSWISLLSSQSPWRSQVETLYPSVRLGNLKHDQLLPQILKNHGYYTVYLTDCATTAAMKLEYGYQEIWQVDDGAFKSTAAILTTAHPFINLYAELNLRNFFPEFNSYSSALYQPQYFFQILENKLKDLDAQKQPYFIAAHSCLTHRDVTQHSLPSDSTLLTDLPADVSVERRNLKAALRWGDSYFYPFFQNLRALNSRPWLYLFSDHGVRIDEEAGNLKYFSHALGAPINRFQYHIPLSIYPPFSLSGEIKQQVSLLDIAPTVLHSAGIDVPEQFEGTNLLNPLSKNGRGFVLSSAISLSHPKDYQKAVLPLITQGHFDRSGDFYFSTDTDKKLRESRSISYLKLPYRLLLDDKGFISLYDEEEDPFSKKDLISTKWQVAMELRNELCSKFPQAPCIRAASQPIARQ